MRDNEFWTAVREKGAREDAPAAGGALKAALVFAAVVIAAAMFAGPLLGSGSHSLLARRDRGSYDMLTTGSIPANAERTYTLRRSITQPMPDSLCIINENGSRHGDC